MRAISLRDTALWVMILSSSFALGQEELWEHASSSEFWQPRDARVFVDYSKVNLALGHADDWLGERKEVYVYQPNAVPKIGVALSLGDYLSASYSATPAGMPQDQSRGTTEIADYRFHFTPKQLAVDLEYQRYEGFYRDIVAKAEVRPFQDALFSGRSPDALQPGMVLQALQIGAVYNLEQWDLGQLMAQERPPLNTGHGVLIKMQYRDLLITGDDELVPPQLRSSLDHDSFAGMGLRSLALMPGYGGLLARGDFYVGAVGFLGWEAQSYRLIGLGRNGSKGAAVVDMRGSIGHNNDKHFYGLNAYKQLVTNKVMGLNISFASSSVEAFWGRHF